MALHFDDTYTGPRFTYGLTYRPPRFANVPDGWIVDSERPHPDFRHGTIAYPEPLTDRQIESFQLTPIPTNMVQEAQDSRP